MKKILFITALLLLNGCAAYYPQMVDIPLIKEKGDIRVDAGAFFSPKIDDTTPENEEKKTVKSDPVSNLGIHGTFTAGITNVLAFQAYLCADAHFRAHIQSALGLYKRFENGTVTEVYGGIGYGGGFAQMMSVSSRDNYVLTFTQINVGKTDVGKNHFDYGLGLKGGYIFTHTPDSSSVDIYKKDGWIVEPSVFLRFGSSRIKFCAKVNYMWTNSVVERYYYYPVSISLGVNFRLGKKIK